MRQKSSCKVLSDEQAEHFLRRGHVVLPACFARETALEWTERFWARTGYDPGDPKTWKEKRMHLPASRRLEIKKFAPKAWDAMCDLLGSEERIVQPCFWGDGFIANLGVGAGQPWSPPSAHFVPVNGRWHKDGDFFRHFLDSPEQALLTVILWSDIHPRGGGTFLACDSIAPVARLLQAHPEGLPLEEVVAAAASLVKECRDFVEVTGEAGDVILMHPYMLHTVSQNHLGIPRLITNPAPALKEPMQFDREDPLQYSAVELAVLRGLGVKRLVFHPTAPRERVVPERSKREHEFRKEEQRRLEAGSHASGV